MNRVAAFALAFLLIAFPARAQGGGEPGRFDYFVLSLSWSPTWCAGKSGRDDVEQCGGLRRYGFVVHGLWPQYAEGGYPRSCAAPSPLPPALIGDMLPLMPSRKLIEHEWAKHGTCATTDPAAYFGVTRAARERVRIPVPLAEPNRPRTLPVAEIERLFAEANPGLSGDAIAVICRGRQLAEVRVCLDRELEFRDCGRDVRDRCKSDALFPAAR